MPFHEMLNEYLRRLSVTALELAEASDLSPAIISRYRSAERRPAPDSEALARLAKGIALLAEQKGIPAASEESVLSAFRKSLGYEEDGQTRLAANFDLLVNVLHLRSGEMARALSFDPSYLSRIRKGQRTPANPAAFARAVGNFTARRCRNATERADLARLLGQPPEALSDDASCSAALARWLLSGEAGQPDSTFSFLEKLDEFDLNDYIRAVRFDQLKIPTVPFQLPSSKMHYGLENFRQALLDFLKSTALSRSREPVFICSDMPMEELARDMEFSKKWMLGLAAILKKGLHLDMVHDLNRPYAEMMLGLESWIPLYMTGQISPWYLRGRHNGVYGHLLFCSGASAVEGECITGDFAHGRCHFSQAKSDLPYYRRRADAILRMAQPLMDIYRDASEGAYSSFLFADAREVGECRAVLTALPPHTLSDECLVRILQKNGVSPSEQENIRRAFARSRAFVASLMQSSTYEEEFPVLSPAAFRAEPPSLALSGLFCGAELRYDEADYQEHLRLTRAFAAAAPGYAAREVGRSAFHNLQIFIRKGKWVGVSKCKAPAIHFVIRHPRLCAALENMVFLVDERVET